MDETPLRDAAPLDERMVDELRGGAQGEDATPLVERMVDELRRGEPADDGQFTIDPERMYARLRAFELPVPQHHVLLMLRGALRAGATRIEIEATPDRLVLQWPESLVFADAEDFFARAWSRSSDPGWRLVALGLAAATNAGLSAATLTSGAVGLRVAKGTVADAASPDPTVGTRIELEGSLMAPYYGDRIESWVIRKRARQVEIPVTLNGERVSQGRMALPEPGAVAIDPYRRRVLDDDEQVPKLPAEAEQTGVLVTGALGVQEHRELRVLVDGVWVATVREEGPPEGLVLVASGGLSLDAAEHRVVEDDAFEEAVRVLHKQKRRRYPTRVNASEIKSQAERARKSLTDTGKRRTVSEVLEPAGLPWNAFVAAGVFAVVLAVAIRIHSGVVTLNDAAAVGTGAVMFTIPFFGLRDARRGPQRWAAWVRREHPPHVQTHSLVLPAPDLRPVRRTAITSLVLIGLALALVGIVTSLDGGVSPMALGFAPLAGLYGLVGGSLLGRAQAPASSPEV